VEIDGGDGGVEVEEKRRENGHMGLNDGDHSFFSFLLFFFFILGFLSIEL